MKKTELSFRNTVKTYNEEFSDFLMDIDIELLELDGVTNLNPFEQRRKYWSMPLQEVSINQNANLGNVGDNKSFINKIAEVNNPVEKLSALYLYRKYANSRHFNGDKLIKDEILGAYYIHNKTLFELPYCIGLPTMPILLGEIQFNDIPTRPPQRPSSFTNLSIRYIQHAANMFAGATALTDFFVNYSFMTKKIGNYDDKSRINDFQNFVHGVAEKERISGQSPFSNLSILSPETIRNMFESYGEYVDIPEIIKNQMLYLRFLSKGIIKLDGTPMGLPYRFPITTFVVDPSFEKEYPEEYREILLMNKDFCFLNFLRNMDNLTRLSMCCRLDLKLSDLLKININSTFGSYLSVGSHAVITLNMPRISYESKGNWSEFERILIERMEAVRKLLLVHRKDILSDRRLKYHDFFKSKILDLKRNFFSTIGFNGLPESIEIMGENICDGKGSTNALKMLSLMKKLTVDFSQEDNVLYNIEEVPGETASGTLAKKDKILYKGEYDFYSSQFVPLYYNIPIKKRCEVESNLQNITTGGSISHINIAGELNEEEGFAFQDKIIKETNLTQYALNRTFTLCKNGHNVPDFYESCPTCGSTDLDWMTRIVGYFVAVSRWNRTKQAEFKTRVWSSWESRWDELVKEAKV